MLKQHQKNWPYAYENLARDIDGFISQVRNIQQITLHSYTTPQEVLSDLGSCLTALDQYIKESGTPQGIEGKIHVMHATRLRDDAAGFKAHFEEEMGLTGQDSGIAH